MKESGQIKTMKDAKNIMKTIKKTHATTKMDEEPSDNRPKNPLPIQLKRTCAA